MRQNDAFIQMYYINNEIRLDKISKWCEKYDHYVPYEQPYCKRFKNVQAFHHSDTAFIQTNTWCAEGERERYTIINLLRILLSLSQIFSILYNKHFELYTDCLVACFAWLLCEYTPYIPYISVMILKCIYVWYLVCSHLALYAQTQMEYNKIADDIRNNMRSRYFYYSDCGKAIFPCGNIDNRII